MSYKPLLHYEDKRHLPVKVIFLRPEVWQAAITYNSKVKIKETENQVGKHILYATFSIYCANLQHVLKVNNKDTNMNCWVFFYERVVVGLNPVAVTYLSNVTLVPSNEFVDVSIIDLLCTQNFRNTTISYPLIHLSACAHVQN